jgi:hypothetical protein
MNHPPEMEVPGGERFRPNGASKHSTPPSAHNVSLVPEVSQAPLVATPLEPIDAATWPVYPGVWFQPERQPLFFSSGLEVARHNRLPAGDFSISGATQPVDLAAKRETPRKAVAPKPSVNVPASNLEPLGWDPRTICRKEGGK